MPDFSITYFVLTFVINSVWLLNTYAVSINTQENEVIMQYGSLKAEKVVN